MMLSRVAERLYWMARYLERAEDTARLVNSYSQLVLDIPRGIEPGWEVLLNIFDASTAYQNRYRKINERNIMKFLMVDTDNQSSMSSSVAAARENVRTTRDALPGQAWELMNEFFLYVNEHAEGSTTRNHRFPFLESVVARNQQLNGLIETSVTRDHALWFIRLGQLIERADMTSRIVDVATAATAAIGKRRSDPVPEIPLLWANMLKSLSATAAFRRRIGPMVTGEEAIDFVFKNRIFPRSILFCLDGIEETCGHLKAPSGLFRSLRSIISPINRYHADLESLPELHALIDDLQAGLADLDEACRDIWFAPAPG
jgi:uncharacterized alpha-E superfamily protein